MNVCLFGLTGSGKTTVAGALAKKLHVERVSSGDIARSMAKSDPHTAVALDRGRMAPEEAMRMQVRAALEQADLRGGWVLEGFPRDLAQLICLMDWTPSLPSFVYLRVEAFVVIERLTARRRADDTPDAIARRIQDFDRITQPMLDVLRAAGVLTTVRSYPDQEMTVREIEELVA